LTSPHITFDLPSRSFFLTEKTAMIASHLSDAGAGLVASGFLLPYSPDPMSRSLAAGLAHHVNNPLLGVIGSLELALLDAPRETALRDRLERSLSCAMLAAEAVRRLVAYAFHPCGGRASVSLRDAAARAARRFHDQGNAQGLLFRLHGDAGRVRVSEPLLDLVIAQLLANACEALPARGTVALHVWEAGDKCGLSIRDDGPGLPAVVQDRLFEPFFSTKGSGHLGLGLVLCRDLIESQGGRLEITSQPGQGVIATVILPTDRPLGLAPPHGLMLRA
jgi:signal transduction histidine kinase